MPGGVNFSIFSKNAVRMELLLFDRDDAPRPTRVIPLDAEHHQTYHYWHVFVPEIGSGQIYGFRAYGPFEPERGLRFDHEKLLLDPYGLAVAVPERYSRVAAQQPGDNTAVAMKSVVADVARYDWEGDRPLQRPYRETVIYELHVRGFTRHPSSGVSRDKAGTYAGLVEKIPYLTDLGVTAVELLPVFQFDDQDAPAGRRNYWGYQPVSLFAPHGAYSSRPGPLTWSGRSTGQVSKSSSTSCSTTRRRAAPTVRRSVSGDSRTGSTTRWRKTAVATRTTRAPATS